MFKKLMLTSLTLLITLTLSSCIMQDKKKALEIISSPFKYENVTLTCKGKKFFGTIEKFQNEDVLLSLTSENIPVSINFLVKEDKIIVSSSDFKEEKDLFPCPPLEIKKALSQLKEEKAEVDKNIFVIKNENYKIIGDLKERKLISIYFKDGVLSF